MTPTPAEVEALARALCKVRGVDPDYSDLFMPNTRAWQWRREEARAYLELQQAAAMVAKGDV